MNIKSLMINKVCTLVVLGFFIVSSVHATTVSVFQESTRGAGDFDTNLLGTIQSFSTPGTLAEFYDYRASEFKNTTVSLTRDQSHLFLVDASDGLGLFVVHDNGASNGGGRAETLLDLVGDTAAFLVQDEPLPDSTRRDSYTESGTQFTAVNGWANGFTDGYVIGSLDGNWMIDMQFADVSGIDTSTQAAGDPTIDNLFTWAAISSDGFGGQTEIALVLEEGRRIRISAVPIPPAIWLFASGLISLIGLARRKASV